MKNVFFMCMVCLSVTILTAMDDATLRARLTEFLREQNQKTEMPEQREKLLGQIRILLDPSTLPLETVYRDGIIFAVRHNPLLHAAIILQYREAFDLIMGTILTSEERGDFIEMRNAYGETPLFVAQNIGEITRRQDNYFIGRLLAFGVETLNSSWGYMHMLPPVQNYTPDHTQNSNGVYSSVLSDRGDCV